MLSKFTATLSAAAMLYGTSTFAYDAENWKRRSVYQLVTDRFAKTDGDKTACSDLTDYCGGTFKGIENHLNYIQGMGFDAIWISPVIENLGKDYHGYAGSNWEKINSHFGSEDDLKQLVQACNDRDIYVMVDVVANHVAPVDGDYSKIIPFNKTEYYHPHCEIDWGNQWTVENCWLFTLPDLKQDHPYVRQYLKDWVSNLVDTYQFDGIRIDTVPHVPKDFWTEYGEASGVFQMGECLNGDPAYVGPYQDHLTALFNYPLYFTIKDVFQGESMHKIGARFAEEKSHFNDMDALGIFVDNHDNPRFLSFKPDIMMFKGALTFALTAQGIPFYYYGSEQAFNGGGDPQNRESLWQSMDTESEIYKMTAAINKARKIMEIWNHPFEEKYVTDNFYCFTRGQFLVATTNTHTDQSIKVQNAGFQDGEEICNIFFPTTDCQTVLYDNVDVYLKNGESKIYIPKYSSFFDLNIQEFSSLDF